MNRFERVFYATVSPHCGDPRLMVVEVDWPRLRAVVGDHVGAVEVAERLIGDHFAVDPNTISVNVRHVLGDTS